MTDAMTHPYAELREALEKATEGPFIDTRFCKLNGEPITTVEEAASTAAISFAHSDRPELFGVTVGDDEQPVVICYTGNGPNSEFNAAFIALARNKVISLLDENQRLREALNDAIDCVEAWGGYASDYFKDKHDFQGDLDRLRTVLKDTP